MSRTYQVAYGGRTVGLDLDPARVAWSLRPADVAAAADVEAEIRRALAEPIGSAPLRELAAAGRKVVVLGDDGTRPTPTDRIVPIVLDELNAGGVPDADITLVIALGTHRPMTGEEIVAKYGPAVVGRVEVVNHDFLDESRLAHFGVTRRGTDIWVNRRVVEADVRVGIGNIVPHHPTGFSGGAKILLPGVAGEHTTGQMHLLGATEQQLGAILTPCREEMEDFAASVGLDFIVNTVLDRHGRLVRAAAGNFIAAHRHGIEWAQKVFGVGFDRFADITISSAQPNDFDLFQADKGLFSAARCTRESGEIILLSPCTEGVSPTHGEVIDMGASTNDELMALAAADGDDDLLSITEMLYLNTIKNRYRTTLATEGIPPEVCRRMGLQWTDPNHLAEYLRERMEADPAATVGILHNSVEILPIRTPSGDF